MKYLKKIFYLINIFCLPFHLLFSFDILQVQFAQKRIAIIGTGYVGLISGAGFAQIGHKVICVDIDQEKIKNLKQGIMPIYEEGLKELVQKHSNNGNLSFTTDIQKALDQSDIIIIAVGTPVGNDGAASMSAFRAVVSSLAQYMSGHKIICIKSTVPVGTNKYTVSFLQKNIKKSVNKEATFDIISNPEFLREGCAVKDFFGRNPIVVGGESKKALYEVCQMYKPLIDDGQPLIVTNPVTAETIKYAWNTFLKVRISYVNDMARFCCAVGADINGIIKGIALSDFHLPTERISPGPGIGGSCFPKDALALINLSRKYGVPLPMVEATVIANKMHKNWIVDQVYELLDNNVTGKNIAILGVAFKANTDDVRYSPAIEALDRFLDDGAHVRVYDPRAMSNMAVLFPDAAYCDSLYDAICDADAILLLTEWNEFKQVNLEQIAKLVRQKNIVDGRNIWDPDELERNGFAFRNLARRSNI